MQTARPIVRLAYPIVALHEQIRPPLSVSDVSRSGVEIDCLSQSQAEAFVVNAIRDAPDRGLEDVGTRRAVQRQRDAAVNDEHRQLVLGAGEAEADALLAGKQRPLGELVDDRCQLVVVEHAVIEVRCVLDWLFAGMGEGNSAGALAAQRVEQREIIASRNADRASDLVAPVLLREKAGKEWTRRAVVERLLLQRQ